MTRRAKVRASARRSEAEVLRLEGELVRLVRDAGMSIAAAQRHLSLPSSWARTRRKRNPGFASDLAKARLAPASVAATWREGYLACLRRGSTRNEALDELRSTYPEVTALTVEEEIDANASFREALREIQVRERWEIEDAQLKRAKKTSVDARAVLARMGGPASAEDGDPTSHSGGEDGLPDFDWVDTEIEGGQVAWLQDKPYGVKRLTDGDGERLLGRPVPVGELKESEA